MVIGLAAELTQQRHQCTALFGGKVAKARSAESRLR
jgi:hypothetical protein